MTCSVPWGNYADDVQPELERIVRERAESLWEMGSTGADLVIAGIGAGLRAFTQFERVEYAKAEGVPAERSLAKVQTVVLETLIAKIFNCTGIPACGQGPQTGKAVPLIDVLHRAPWLMENQPRRLGEFLNEAAPNREQLRLVAVALAGPGLSGKSDEDSRRLLATTADEQSALGKMLGNWKSLVPESLFDAGKR